MASARKLRYLAYLNSPEWAEVKRRYRASSLPQVCVRCHQPGPVDLHHLTYRRLGSERLEDLIPLCRPCHDKEHLAIKARRRATRRPRKPKLPRKRKRPSV